MSYFTFDNKEIYYSETGEGTPLLLLHGNTASSAMLSNMPAFYELSIRFLDKPFDGSFGDVFV